MHALIKELAIRRVQHRSETHSNESQQLAEGTEVARLRRRFAFVLELALSFRTRHPSLQTGGGACEHPTPPFARPGVCTSASYRGVTGTEGQEGASGVGGGIGVGGGNGDGSGVEGGNGDVNGNGNGAEAGTGVEVNEGA